MKENVQLLRMHWLYYGDYPQSGVIESKDVAPRATDTIAPSQNIVREQPMICRNIDNARASICYKYSS